MPQRQIFFIIAGEASGDLLGARLMKALKELTHGEAHFVGIGGPRMRAEGMDVFFQQEELAHFGLFELLKHVPHLLGRIRQTIAEVRRLRPAALITIDAPDFSFRVANELKDDGLPLIHYVAPTVWAWRANRARKIAGFLDHLLALLPFEPPYFTKEGLNCTFVGHPIVESDAGKGNAARFFETYNVSHNVELITLLPGSRMSEVSKLMPIFGATIALLRQHHPRLHIVIPVTPNVGDFVKKQIAQWSVGVSVIYGDEAKYDAMAASQVALACSGTVAIELAMAKLPAVVAYKLSPLTHFLYRRFIKVDYANLVNIMHKHLVVPEFIQNDCTPDKLAAALDHLLCDDHARHVQLTGLSDVAGWLGAGQFKPSERAAETVMKTIADKRARAAVASYTVLQVVPALVTGGVERGTIEVAAALKAAGHRPVVASAGGPMVREIEDLGGVHVTLPLASKNPLRMYRNISDLEKIVRHFKVDIIHARSRAPAWSAWAAARNLRKNFVTTFHNAYGASSRLKRSYNSIMAKGARVIAISDFVGDYAKTVYRVPQEKLRIIPRGVDIESFDPAKVESGRISSLRESWQLPADMPVVMLPARLTRWKGQLVFLEALKILGLKNLTAVIVGKGSSSYRAEIKATAQRLGVSGILHMIDVCRDMPAAYLLADIVVAPSTRPEGFGRVIAEAQAMGRPVIATDHGGARETVIPGQTGWLVAPSDAKALARALAEVLNLSPEARAALAARSVGHIRSHFTTAHMTTRTLAVYDELMHKNSQ